MFSVLPYLQIDVQNQNNTNPTETRKYYPVPPIQPATFEYLNVNKDVKLRKNVTNYFTEKTIEWIQNDDSFKKHKSCLSELKTVDGQMKIYNLLRTFIKRSGINWYDLRDNYSIIKEYLNKKL